MNISAILNQTQNAYTSSVQKQAATAAADLTPDQKRAKATADEFESVFVGQMLEYMSEGVEVDPMFGGGHAEEMWKSMMNQEYGKHIVKNGGLGISKQVMDYMLKAQEEQTVTKQKLAAMGMGEPTANSSAAAGQAAVSAALQR
ncbi:MAG: rod-binding protein [Rhodospirillaceae bacterium]|nr:rod-binding protein [Rhodospirillaceae bacterium]